MKSKPLTATEQLFCSRIANDPSLTEISVVADLWPKLKDHKKKLVLLKRRPEVLEAIQRHADINAYTASYSHQDVVDALWAEANMVGRGTNQTARIQALVWLGKHIGTFSNTVGGKEDKGEVDQGNVFNIVNYKTHNASLEQSVQHAVEKLIPEAVEIPEGLTITTYNRD